jgi:hypothetical protein
VRLCRSEPPVSSCAPSAAIRWTSTCIPASIWDPQAFIARLAEIVCHDNFTEMHAFKHHQSIVGEYHATHEPWRWMHLVCGAQAAASSFGKSMTVYEEYLELLHAA